jgi:hypothetical protein
MSKAAVMIGVLAYGPILLFLDSRLAHSWPGQYLLGALTAGVLLLCAQALPRRERCLAWLCVLVSTGFECLGSLVWQGYTYRFHNVPAFVPFGHGVIYVFGALLARTTVIRRYERAFTWFVLGVASLWALAGVSVLTPSTGRTDLHGLVWLPVFAYALLVSPRRAFFAALFIATSDIEIAGTILGNWSWALHTPWLHVTSGNPPAAIAGGYAIIDGSMLALAKLFDAYWGCLAGSITSSLRLTFAGSASACTIALATSSGCSGVIAPKRLR